MADVEIKRPDPPATPVPVVAIIADRDMYYGEDGHTVYEKGDPKGRFLLAARGSTILPDVVARYGLSASGGKVSQKSAKEMAQEAAEKGLPLDLGTPNEGQLRPPGEPLILVPRTGVMRSEPADRVVPELGTEVSAAPKMVAVSNVPPGDDALRAAVKEETEGDGAEEPAPRKATAAKRKSARKGK